MVDLDSTSTWTDFEVIKLMDESMPYPALLGIYWATNMNKIINLKKWTMVFETKSLRMVISLDQVEGPRYTEPMCDKESENDVDCSYRMATKRWECVKTVEDRRISQGYE